MKQSSGALLKVLRILTTVLCVGSLFFPFASVVISFPFRTISVDAEIRSLAGFVSGGLLGSVSDFAHSTLFGDVSSRIAAVMLFYVCVVIFAFAVLVLTIIGFRGRGFPSRLACSGSFAASAMCVITAEASLVTDSAVKDTDYLVFKTQPWVYAGIALFFLNAVVNLLIYRRSLKDAGSSPKGGKSAKSAAAVTLALSLCFALCSCGEKEIQAKETVSSDVPVTGLSEQLEFVKNAWDSSFAQGVYVTHDFTSSVDDKLIRTELEYHDLQILKLLIDPAMEFIRENSGVYEKVPGDKAEQLNSFILEPVDVTDSEFSLVTKEGEEKGEYRFVFDLYCTEDYPPPELRNSYTAFGFERLAGIPDKINQEASKACTMYFEAINILSLRVEGRIDAETGDLLEIRYARDYSVHSVLHFKGDYSELGSDDFDFEYSSADIYSFGKSA